MEVKKIYNNNRTKCYLTQGVDLPLLLSYLTIYIKIIFSCLRYRNLHTYTIFILYNYSYIIYLI